MSQLTPADRQRIYEEEQVRAQARQHYAPQPVFANTRPFGAFVSPFEIILNFVFYCLAGEFLLGIIGLFIGFGIGIIHAIIDTK